MKKQRNINLNKLNKIFNLNEFSQLSNTTII